MAYDKSPGYIDHLLILRGLSAIGVLFAHCLNQSSYSWGSYLSQAHNIVTPFDKFLVAIWPSTGVNYVMFFFVHSGYLMGKVFFQKRYSTETKDILRYYKSRFFRIAPLLYFNLLFIFGLTGSSGNPLHLFGDLFFLNNLTGRSINAVTWSLSYEMQYYLLAPFIFLFFGNLSVKSFLKIFCLALTLSSLAYFRDYFLLFTVLSFFYFFVIGFSINLLIRLFKVKKFKFSVPLSIFVGFIGGNILYYYFYNNGHRYTAEITLALFAAAAIYMLELPDKEDSNEAENITLRVLFLRFLTWTGIISYGIYMWHLPVLLGQHRLIEKLMEHLYKINYIKYTWQKIFLYHSIQIPLVIILTYLISYVTFMLIELRFRPNLYNFESSRILHKHGKFRKLFKR
jgi:peptidoglycan/LPS O-acetylase OafA/YrhL